jgi:hypothetical protein
MAGRVGAVVLAGRWGPAIQPERKRVGAIVTHSPWSEGALPRVLLGRCFVGHADGHVYLQSQISYS